ncbi:MAG: alpha/beta fold hydrolase [Bacillaceae bacterium]
MNNVQKIKINNIPCLSISPSETIDKQVTIFIYHGWGSTVENQLFLGEILAKWGYQVVIPELIYHDSRQSLKNHFIATATEAYFWKTILYAVVEANSLIEAAHNDGLIKGHKVVILGSSMGGFIASSVFMRNSSIHGLITINGSASWMVSEQEFQKNGSQPSAFIDDIIKYDPMNNIQSLNNRPALLLHGEGDTVVHPIAQQLFYKEVIKHSNDVNNVTLQLIPNVNHIVTLSMVESIVQWLQMNVAINLSE